MTSPIWPKYVHPMYIGDVEIIVVVGRSGDIPFGMATIITKGGRPYTTSTSLVEVRENSPARMVHDRIHAGFPEILADALNAACESLHTVLPVMGVV